MGCGNSNSDASLGKLPVVNISTVKSEIARLGGPASSSSNFLRSCCPHHGSCCIRTCGLIYLISVLKSICSMLFGSSWSDSWVFSGNWGFPTSDPSVDPILWVQLGLIETVPTGTRQWSLCDTINFIAQQIRSGIDEKIIQSTHRGMLMVSLWRKTNTAKHFVVQFLTLFDCSHALQLALARLHVGPRNLILSSRILSSLRLRSWKGLMHIALSLWTIRFTSGLGVHTSFSFWSHSALNASQFLW